MVEGTHLLLLALSQDGPSEICSLILQKVFPHPRVAPPGAARAEPPTLAPLPPSSPSPASPLPERVAGGPYEREEGSSRVFSYAWLCPSTPKR
jgi:hypothetical protein